VPQPPARDDELALNLLLHGVFTQERFLDLLRGYVSFAEEKTGPVKRIAKPHQYFVVDQAVRETIKATRSNGRAGVVWHTQGSGKSMEMELYANQIATHPSLGNPTIVVITDRTDLDDQLYSTFAASQLLPEQPVQAATRDALRTELTNRRTGGIIFTTLQKFGKTREERDAGRSHPLLSERRNIIVIVDEAHRSHYDNLDGYARHLRDALPYATMVAFTGTPISEADRNTRAGFGDYIFPTYDLTRAVEDGATVRVFHESRLIPVDLPAGVDPETIDDRVDVATAGLDEAERKRIQRSVAVMNEIYGAPDRLRTLAADLVAHWETRSGLMRKFMDGPGKGMIVCATRDIAARLYQEIAALRPDWHAGADDRGKLKVIYTGGPDDEAHIRRHVRRPSQTKAVQQRIKNPDDELELVIVQSMLLTGFDAPPLHTLYLDKPMRGAALMQALARVNRPFRSKPDGLLVGYAPITQSLHEALAEYTDRDQERRPVGQDIDELVAQLRDLHRVLCDAILRDHDWRGPLAAGGKSAFREAVLGTVDHLRDPSLRPTRSRPGNPRWPSGSGAPPPSWSGSTRCAPPAVSSTGCATTSRTSRRSGCGWPSSTWPTGRRAGCPYRRRSPSTFASSPPA
jgi:type I restriction enzyme R subunit